MSEYIKLLNDEYDVEYLIFGREYCKYCVKSKKYLCEKDISHKYLDLDIMDVNGNILKMIKEYTNAKTIPIIFKKEEFIGGFKELKNYE